MRSADSAMIRASDQLSDRRYVEMRSHDVGEAIVALTETVRRAPARIGHDVFARGKGSQNRAAQWTAGEHAVDVRADNAAVETHRPVRTVDANAASLEHHAGMSRDARRVSIRRGCHRHTGMDFVPENFYACRGAEDRHSVR